MIFFREGTDSMGILWKLERLECACCRWFTPLYGTCDIGKGSTDHMVLSSDFQSLVLPTIGNSRSSSNIIVPQPTRSTRFAKHAL